MIIKNDNDKRIKSCYKCNHIYLNMYEKGCTYNLPNNCYKDHPFSKDDIPSWCQLPNWERTLKV